MTQSERQELLNEQYTIILDREAKLRSKDYIGTKIAMGVATAAEYAAEIAGTEVWRQEINAAQAEVARLEAIEVEEEEDVSLTNGEE